MNEILKRTGYRRVTRVAGRLKEGDFHICTHSHPTATSMVGESCVLFDFTHIDALNSS